MEEETVIATIYHRRGDGLRCVVETTYFENKPVCWGIVLGDFVRTLSKSIAKAYNVPEPQALDDILEVFDRELQLPSSDIDVRPVRPV